MNENFRRLPGDYLFSDIARRTAAFQAEHPGARLIRLGIGDVTCPLPAAVSEAMAAAAREMGTAAGFHGYGPEQGYAFLREAIASYDYAQRGVSISPDEVFVSDGAKSDCGNVGDLFSADNVAAVCDPVYPAYVEGNVMAGRAGEYDRRTGRWSRVRYLPCTPDNGFFPQVPADGELDLIYLCYPNNPTGAAASREQLRAWVDYANARGALILYDSAYEAYITQPDLPHSIFEIPGAESCAVELRSFSKTAGFTGVRCAYMVIPQALERGGMSLNAAWARRQAARFNGVAYVVQRGAQAVYSHEGRSQVREAIAGYQENAKLLRAGLTGAGLTVYGGVNAPYLWVRAPEGMGSWEFFDLLLRRAYVVTTPGAGFGPGGEGYLRLTAFGAPSDTREAVERIGAIL